MVKKYLVSATKEHYYEQEVEAESEAQAMHMALENEENFQLCKINDIRFHSIEMEEN